MREPWALSVMEEQRKKPRILITAQTGFIIRNLLLGKFAPEISKDAELLVAVLDPNDPKLQEIAQQHPNISFVDIHLFSKPPVKTNIDYFKIFHYNMYLMYIAFKNNESIKMFRKVYDSKVTRKQAFAQQSVIFLGHVLKFLGLRNWIIRKYLDHYAKHEVTQQWEEALKKYQPDFVLSTMLSLAHRLFPSHDLPLVLAARKQNIKVGTLIQSWDNLSTKPSIIPDWLDKYYTWSDEQTKELLDFYPSIPKENIIAVGSPQFDFHKDPIMIEDRSSYLKRIGLDETKDYLLIGTGMAMSLPDEIDDMIKMLRKLNQEFPDLQYLMRIHPKDTTGRIDQYMDELPSLNTIVQFSSPKNKEMDAGGFVPPTEFYKEQVNAIYHSRIVINSSSTITVDSSIVGRPVICIAYNYTPDPLFPKGRSLTYANSVHYSRLANTGGAWIVTSEEECVTAVETYLNNPEFHEANRKKIVSTVTNECDGNAGRRLAENILG